MAKKKNQKKAEAQTRKSAVESLRFQTHWGLKQLGQEDGNVFHLLVDAEVNSIAELELAQDLLAIKSFVDAVKQSFMVTPTTEMGDFVKSPTAVALGIAHINNLDNMSLCTSLEKVEWIYTITVSLIEYRVVDSKATLLRYPMAIERLLNGYRRTIEGLHCR